VDAICNYASLLVSFRKDYQLAVSLLSKVCPARFLYTYSVCVCVCVCVCMYARARAHTHTHTWSVCLLSVCRLCVGATMATMPTGQRGLTTGSVFRRLRTRPCSSAWHGFVRSKRRMLDRSSVPKLVAQRPRPGDMATRQPWSHANALALVTGL